MSEAVTARLPCGAHGRYVSHPSSPKIATREVGGQTVTNFAEWCEDGGTDVHLGRIWWCHVHEVAFARALQDHVSARRHRKDECRLSLLWMEVPE